MASKTPVALVPTAHKGLKVRQLGSADHLKENHIAKVSLPEFTRASLNYPIVFMQDSANNEFFAVTIWGFEPGQNLFVEDDHWVGGFLPASSRCYPFAMDPSPDDPTRLFIGLYEDAPLLNKEEGELIFNEDGTETEWMSKTKEFLVKVYEQELMTKTMLNELDKQGLLIPQSLSIQFPDDEEDKQVSGFFIVDREKLAALSDEDFLKIRKSNMLEAIYAHFASLENIDKLLLRRNTLLKK